MTRLMVPVRHIIFYECIIRTDTKYLAKGTK